MCCMTSVTRNPPASQTRASTSSTGLSSRASDVDRSATAAALSPRDAEAGASCFAPVPLVPSVAITGEATPCSSVTEKSLVSAAERHAGPLACFIFIFVFSMLHGLLHLLEGAGLDLA